MSNHTPGPWVIREQDIIGNEQNGYICTWSGRSANANLIAAAPDLLIELESMVDQYEILTDNVALTARVAIAKARGMWME